MVEGHPHILRREYDRPDCGIPRQGFGRSRFSKGSRSIELTTAKSCKVLGKPRGFGRRDEAIICSMNSMCTDAC